MADISRSSVQNRVLEDLNLHERFSSTDIQAFITEKRRNFKDLIQRLEHIVTVQQDRVKAMQHRSGGGRSQARRLRALMKENLLTYRHTLQQVRHAGETLEVAWSALE